jgi:hypothetical protein
VPVSSTNTGTLTAESVTVGASAACSFVLSTGTNPLGPIAQAASTSGGTLTLSAAAAVTVTSDAVSVSTLVIAASMQLPLPSPLPFSLLISA